MTLPIKSSPSKVIFLDIDGVLQGGRQDRFAHKEDGSFDRIVKEARERFAYIDQTFDYMFEHSAFVYDLLATVYDWEKPAVSRYKKLLTDHDDAGIVMSSSWRRMGAQAITLFLSLHGIENRLSGATLVDYRYYDREKEKLYSEYDRPKDKFLDDFQDSLEQILNLSYVEIRAAEIYSYLLTHPEIESFVVIDDIDLSKYFTKNAVVTGHIFTEEDYVKARSILDKPADLSLLEKIPEDLRKQAKTMQDLSDQVFW